MEEKDLCFLSSVFSVGFILMLVLLALMVCINQKYKKNKNSLTLKIALIHSLNFVMIITINVMNMFFVLAFGVYISGYDVNKYTNIFTIFLWIFTITTVILDSLFWRFFIEIKKYFTTKKELLSIVIKTLTAITLLITGIKGMFDDFNILNIGITFLSLMTFVYAYIEISIERTKTKRKRKKEKIKKKKEERDKIERQKREKMRKKENKKKERERKKRQKKKRKIQKKIRKKREKEKNR
ncbi:hypothetical protein [Staphylococcus hominis]|uniref:hypothetical protein n=1 Tax=Staphylococcus hominis TaxID=1290 RepID=UPI00287AB1B2|nr:hypothetical protein [Staphylococcus hominis]MDS3871835.1 hypothetical protein [Staphylococcus hominis]